MFSKKQPFATFPPSNRDLRLFPSCEHGGWDEGVELGLARRQMHHWPIIYLCCIITERLLPRHVFPSSDLLLLCCFNVVSHCNKNVHASPAMSRNIQLSGSQQINRKMSNFKLTEAKKFEVHQRNIKKSFFKVFMCLCGH